MRMPALTKLDQLKDREGLYIWSMAYLFVEDVIWSTFNLNTQGFYKDDQYAHIVIVPY